MKFISKIFGKLLKIILIVLLLIIVLAVVLYLSAGKLIQYFAPEFISQVTQTETSLGEVDVSLLSGRLALNNLAIGNPAGFKDKNVFELGNIFISFDPKSILSEKIVVNDVVVSGVQVSTELNAQGKTNVAELLNNVNQFIGTEDKDTVAPAQQGKVPAPVKEDDSSKSVVIRDLKIENSFVRAGIAGQMMEVALPEIHQQNIGEGRDESLAEVVVGVLNTINVESTKAVLQATKETLTKNIENGKGALQNLKDSFKNLF